MSQDNQISEVVDPAVKTQFIQKIAEALALLPFLRNIPKGEKRKYSGIAKNRAGLDEVCVRLMTQHPELVPSFINMVEVNKDVALRMDLREMTSPVRQLLETLLDTELVGSSDSMKAYRPFYAAAKLAAKHDAPGMDAVVAELAPFFDTSGEPDEPTPPPTP